MGVTTSSIAMEMVLAIVSISYPMILHNGKIPMMMVVAIMIAGPMVTNFHLTQHNMAILMVMDMVTIKVGIIPMRSPKMLTNGSILIKMG